MSAIISIAKAPVPPAIAGCAGSPWGDNWTTWQADFYTPAAPLLAAAPIVLVRGNHEDCERAGPGWLQAAGALGFDPAGPAPVHLPLYSVDLGGLTLAVMDDATAEETELDRESAASLCRRDRRPGAHLRRRSGSCITGRSGRRSAGRWAFPSAAICT